LLTEGLVLAIAGGLAGLFFAHLALQGMISAGPAAIFPDPRHPSISARFSSPPP